LVYVLTEKTYRFGKCLVDGLVESDDVIQTGGFRLAFVHPQAKNTGAQGAVLGS
jgi:hypothetical protein